MNEDIRLPFDLPAVARKNDTSPAMLARARRRCPTLSAGGRLYRMDVTALLESRYVIDDLVKLLTLRAH